VIIQERQDLVHPLVEPSHGVMVTAVEIAEIVHGGIEALLPDDRYEGPLLGGAEEGDDFPGSVCPPAVLGSDEVERSKYELVRPRERPIDVEEDACDTQASVTGRSGAFVHVHSFQIYRSAGRISMNGLCLAIRGAL
jgi:hypothetical protein